MAKAVNKTVVGVLTLAIVLVLTGSGYVVVANLPGQDPTRYVKDAEKFAKDGKWAEARTLYIRAYRKDPAQNPEYLVEAARCAKEEGDIAKALGDIQGARLKNPDHPAAAVLATQLQFEVANVFSNAQQWVKVKEEAERLLAKVDPKSVLGHHARGAALLRLALEDEENRALGEASLREALKLDPTNVDVVELLVANAFDRMRVFESRRQRTEVAAMNKSIDTLLADQLTQCEQAGEVEKAGRVKILQADVLLRRGEDAKAVEALERYTQSNSKDARGFRSLGAAYLMSAKFRDASKAEGFLRKAVELDPKDLQNRLILGQALQVQKDRMADESKVYEEGLEAVPFSKHYRSLKSNFQRAEMIYRLVVNDIRRGAAAEGEDQKKAFADAESKITKLSDEQDPKFPTVLLMQAMLYSAKGDLKEATRVAQLADRGSPTYEAKCMLGELLFRQGEWGAARKELEAAVEMGPRALVPVWQLAQVYLRLDVPALAIKLLKPETPGPLRDTLMSDSRATELRMEAYRALKQYDLAEAESKRLAQLTGDKGGESTVRQAQLLLLAEKFKDAEEILQPLVSADKVELKVAQMYVYLLETTERRDDAIAFVNQMMKKAPEERAYKQMSLFLNRPAGEEVKDEDIRKLIEEYEKDPFNRAWQIFQFYASKAQFEKAQEYLDKAEKEKPEDPTVLDRQLLMALNAKDWGRAERYVERNRQLNIDGTKGKIAKGRLATARAVALRAEAAELQKQEKKTEAEAKTKEANDQYSQAIESIKSGLDAYPNYSIGWTNLAEAYAGAGLKDECRSALRRALDLDPTNGLANRAMVQVLIEDGDEDRAQEFLDRAYRILPNDPFLKARVEAREEKKTPAEGIKKRELVRSRDPKDVMNLVRLAQLYRTAEKYDKAAEVYEQALTAAKDDAKVSYLQLLREVAFFYADPKVNRPADGEGLLQEALTQRESLADKAMLEIYLSRFYEIQQQLSTAERHIQVAVTLDSSASVLISAADFFRRVNKLRDAMGYYDRALKAGTPDEKAVRKVLIQIALAMNDYPRAKTEIDAFIDRYTDDSDGKILLATYHMKGGDINEAEKALSAILERQPENAQALWQRGGVYLLKGNYQQAVDDLSKSKVYKPDGFNYMHRINLADALLETGKSEEAITELKSILDKYPDQIDVAGALADIYFRVKPSRYLDAERLVRTYMAKFPRDERWALYLGRLGRQAGNKDQAIDGYSRAAEVSEYRPNVVQSLIDTLRWANRPQAVIDLARDRLSARRLDQIPSVQAALGWAYTELGDSEKAFAAYDAALSVTGADFSAHASILMEMCDAYGFQAVMDRTKARLAEKNEDLTQQKSMLFLLWKNKQISEATEVAQRIIDQAKDDRDRLYARMAMAALFTDAKKLEEARGEYEEVLKIEPGYVVALNNLACLLNDDLGRPAEALPYAEKSAKVAAETIGNNSDILDTLGWIQSCNKDYGKATTNLLRALESNADHIAANYHLGLVYKQRGDSEEARRRLEKARKAESSRVEAVRKDQEEKQRRLSAKGIKNGSVPQEVGSDILPKIEKELSELK